MNGRDCAKCQKSREGTHGELLKLFNEKDKTWNSDLLHLKEKKGEIDNGGAGSSFRERSPFSLDFRPIGLSVLDGARSKVDLRDEGYAWAPIWWSSNNFKR